MAHEHSGRGDALSCSWFYAEKLAGERKSDAGGSDGRASGCTRAGSASFVGPQASRLTSVTRVTAATSAGCLSSAAAAACAANAYPENLPVQRPLLQQQLQVGTAMRCVGVEVQRLQRMRSDRARFEPDRRVDIFCHDGMHSRDGCILHETSTIRQYIAIVSGSGAGAELAPGLVHRTIQYSTVGFGLCDARLQARPGGDAAAQVIRANPGTVGDPST